jgi:hypothetical protein
MLHHCFLIGDNLLVLITTSSMMLSDRINSILLYTTTVSYLITLKRLLVLLVLLCVRVGQCKISYDTFLLSQVMGNSGFNCGLYTQFKDC